jgi:hypothetical protein
MPGQLMICIVYRYRTCNLLASFTSHRLTLGFHVGGGKACPTYSDTDACAAERDTGRYRGLWGEATG